MKKLDKWVRFVSVSVFWTLIVVSVFFAGCEDNGAVDPFPIGTSDTTSTADDTISSQTKYINNWIYDNMEIYYLWASDIPSVNPNKQPDSEKFFYSLLNDEDNWSWITDDYEALMSEYSGTPESMGYSPSFGKFSNSNEVFIVVEYVYPNSPAERAGLERGDIILTIDGKNMTIGNYYDLYSGKSYTVGLGVMNGNTIYESGETIQMTAEVIQTNPSIYHEVIDQGGIKIGYLVYVEFIAGDNNEFLDSLGYIFDDFKAQGVSEVIVDLRYNPGGEQDAAGFLASALAPSNVVSSQEVLMNFVYNEVVQNSIIYYEGNASSSLIYRFPENPYNMNLNRVYFLTSSGSASASEFVIVGLEPYMDVVMVGDSTYGKYAGAWVIPDDNEPPRHNWAIQPVVLKYSNAVGYTDFKDGLIPDYYMEDDIFNAKPFGDLSDPVVAKAIELITGSLPMETSQLKSASRIPYQRIFSKKDHLKRNIIMNRMVTKE